MITFESIKNKIPIIKDVDFKDPKSRKNFLILCAAFATIAVFFISLINDLFVSSTPDQIEDNRPRPVMTIQDGEDNDSILDTKEMSDVYEEVKGGTGGNHRAGEYMRDMFQRSEVYSDEELDMKAVKEDANKPKTNDIANSMQQSSDTPKSVQDQANEFFFGTQIGQSNVYGQEDHHKEAPESNVNNAKQSRSDSQQKIVGKEDKGKKKKSSTASSTNQNQGQKTHSVSRQVEDEYPKEETLTSTSDNTDEAPKTVRRSGSVSSLRDKRDNGTRSLKTAERFITEDENHPYKVMFLRDEKIRSGQRVTLRLLEDMIVDGLLIPKNSHLTATCNVSDRLEINVSSIQIDGKFYALNFQAYDNDGHKGLYCPDTQSSKITSDVGQEAIQIGQSALSSQFLGTAGSVFSSGVSVLRNARGETAIKATAGYTFYLLKDKN